MTALMIATSPLNSVFNDNKTFHTDRKVPDTTVVGEPMKLVKARAFLHAGVVRPN